MDVAPDAVLTRLWGTLVTFGCGDGLLGAALQRSTEKGRAWRRILETMALGARDAAREELDMRQKEVEQRSRAAGMRRPFSTSNLSLEEGTHRRLSCRSVMLGHRGGAPDMCAASAKDLRRTTAINAGRTTEDALETRKISKMQGAHREAITCREYVVPVHELGGGRRRRLRKELARS
jgi:hypothetical protein